MTENEARELAARIPQENPLVATEVVQRGGTGNLWAVRLTLRTWELVKVCENRRVWPSLKIAWDELTPR
jgi:hypothetical protein